MSNNIRVLHVIESLGRGGAERQLVNNLRAIARNRFDNTVCFLYERDDLQPELVRLGIPVYKLDMSSPYDWRRGLFGLRAVIKEGQFDVIHTELCWADIYGRICGRLFSDAKIVTTIHAAIYEPQILKDDPNLQPWKLTLVRILDGLTGALCNHRFIACSEFVKQSAVKRLGYRPESIGVIYNGIDLGSFNKDSSGKVVSLRRELGLDHGEAILVNVSRLIPQKGQRYLIMAMPKVLNKYPSARLFLVGGGPMASELRELTHDLGVEEAIKFLGTRHDVPAILQLSDLFVLPSLSEGMPVALLEAMAMRKPCIASKITSIPEVVEDGRSGLSVEPQRPDQLANAILSLINDPGRRQAMGTRGRQIVEEKFSINVNIRLLENLYERVVVD